MVEVGSDSSENFDDPDPEKIEKVTYKDFEQFT